uniref:ORF3 n=1 Tax=Sowbane mosaic virus TaxID=378833 RepID=E0YU14_9VIRU|nr:ORF3 [Sowbane mosaic virus]
MHRAPRKPRQLLRQARQQVPSYPAPLLLQNRQMVLVSSRRRSQEARGARARSLQRLQPRQPTSLFM